MSTGFLRGSGSGEFDLVLWPLGLPGPRFFDVVAQYPDTRFVFLDYCCAKGDELGGAPNATALTLRAGEAAHLAGYLSGLMEARRTLPQGGRHLVSIIGGKPGFPPQQALVQGFSTGVRRALPGVEILSQYSASTTTRRRARGSRTGKSTPARASSSPQQATVLWARSRPPPYAACGASRAASRIPRTSARTFSRPRPNGTIASST